MPHQRRVDETEVKTADRISQQVAAVQLDICKLIFIVKRLAEASQEFPVRTVDIEQRLRVWRYEHNFPKGIELHAGGRVSGRERRTRVALLVKACDLPA